MTLFDGLFDDAALFPPGDTPMAAAVPAHGELRERLGGLVGPFVVPAARLDELIAHLRDEIVDVSLIAGVADLPAAVARVVAEPRLRLAAIEVPVVGEPDDVGRLPRLPVPVAVEIPRGPAQAAVLDRLAGSGHRAKIRTGGLRADLFPDEAELAATIIACVTRGVPFKCTAGLHHAVRHTDPATGFEHHGFLNVLAAAGGDPGLLADRDGAALAGVVSGWSPAECARARSVFTSFGTCSVLEPVADLAALGLLPRDRIWA